jgi:hypothetical protein
MEGHLKICWGGGLSYQPQQHVQSDGPCEIKRPIHDTELTLNRNSTCSTVLNGERNQH